MNVILYDLNENDFITGWRLFPVTKKPELLNIPMPTPEMKVSLKDAFGNYKYKLTNGLIEEVITTPTEHQLAINQILSTQIYKILKTVIAEIDSLRDVVGGTPTLKYSILKNILNKIQNGD